MAPQQPLPACPWRTQMPNPAVYHCAHIRLTSPGNFVGAPTCRRCIWHDQPNPTPRRVPEFNPGAWQLLKNYSVAGLHHFLAGRPLAPPSVPATRAALCKGGCAYWNGTSCQHKQCGCGQRQGGMEEKWRWADSACPIGKWGPSFDV